MSQKKPYSQLTSVLEETRDGRILGFHASLDRVVGQMELDLDEIAGEFFNNVRLRDGQKSEKLEKALEPVLKMAAAVSNSVSDAQGARVVDIPPEDRDGFNGETSVNLLAAEDQIFKAVNLWIDVIDRHPALPLPGLPLADNHGIRTGDATHIHHLSDILTLGDDGYSPKKFRTNDEAKQALKNAAVAAGHDSLAGGP